MGFLIMTTTIFSSSRAKPEKKFENLTIPTTLAQPSRRTAVMDLIVFEDEHLLAVNKPAGWNTHSPAPFAGEGVYEWLRDREPRWSRLSIIHRLDKETSGIMVFGKTAAANRSLSGSLRKAWRGNNTYY